MVSGKSYKCNVYYCILLFYKSKESCNFQTLLLLDFDVLFFNLFCYIDDFVSELADLTVR